MNNGIVCALASAALFGASTPLSKLLLNEMSPVLLGGLLYLGSGLGLSMVRIFRDRSWKSSGLQGLEWAWLLSSMLFGGVLGPVALLYGLRLTSGASASLLLNLEAVLTALLAWLVFHEHTSRRVVIGMLAIVAGGLVLSWPSSSVNAAHSDWLGPLLIGAACLCWAIDNNLTRKVSASDAVFIASSKGLVAGVVNCTMAFFMGATWPSASAASLAMLLGLLGYGVSLVLFVLALRELGTARAGAYFSTAPFMGATVALLVLGEALTPLLGLAALLMACGVWLHWTETHDHEHTHEVIEHSHRHVHDEHHQHAHSAEVTDSEPHTHWHRHEPLRHAHPHYPDIHHRHRH